MKLPQHYVATETAVFDFRGHDENKPQVLLIQRGCEPYKGMWAMPGGFLEENEFPNEGAARELYEETGVDIPAADLLQMMTVGRKEDRPHQTIVVVYSAVVDKREQVIEAGDDAMDVAWVPIDELPALAANHLEIIRKVLGEIYYDTV